MLGQRRKPGSIGREKLDPGETDDRLALDLYAAIASQALGEAQQPRFEFAAENSPNAEFSQERFIHWCVQTVNAQVSRGGERFDARDRFDRDARGGVHADVDRHEAGAGEGVGIERLQRKIDARHLQARPFQPCGGLCERERLAPQFVRIDEHRLERSISLRAPHGLQGYAGERDGNFFGCVKHIAAR